ncbi:hypothetical protein ACVIW0_007416 [Bradyrhizobium sp. USDA 4454]
MTGRPTARDPLIAASLVVYPFSLLRMIEDDIEVTYETSAPVGTEIRQRVL